MDYASLKVSRDYKEEGFSIGDVDLAGDSFTIIAGPCAVEGEAELLETARGIKKLGLNFLRGGAFKPRTSPYSFQGLEKEGLTLLKKAKEETGLRIITEIVSVRDLEDILEVADIIQVGARNMYNYELLKELSRIDRPVMLKRGFSASLEEFVLSAEYILAGGNERVILCERGIRSFNSYTRNTLDLSLVPMLKSLSHLPVFVDPSHGTGIKSLIEPMSKAAVACGADGLIIEVHKSPAQALCDGDQSLNLREFESLLGSLEKLIHLEGKSF